MVSATGSPVGLPAGLKLWLSENLGIPPSHRRVVWSKGNGCSSSMMMCLPSTTLGRMASHLLRIHTGDSNEGCRC